MGTFLSIVFAVLSFLIWLGANQQHREQTGFNLPSANARKRIRRNARRKGISETKAHAEWVINKRARLPKGSYVPAPPAPPAPPVHTELPPASIIPPASAVVSDDEPEQAFLISSPVQAEMSYKGHPYSLHSDYKVSGVLNGVQVRWKSLHSFRRWVDARIAAPVAPLISLPEPPPAPPVQALQVLQPEPTSPSRALAVLAALLVLAAVSVWGYVSISHPGLGTNPIHQNADPKEARSLLETASPTSGQPAVQSAPQADAQVPQRPQRETVVTKRSGNIRERPDRTAPVSRTVQAGMNFYIFTKERDWIQIGVEKPWGWMHSSLLKPTTP